MIYEIKKYGCDKLREKACDVGEITKEIKDILSNMAETMINSNGVGLAAPQVGIEKRMFVCMLEPEVIKKVIDPVITPYNNVMIDFEEGCLSIPGIYKNVKRYKTVILEYTDENGDRKKEKLEDFKAVVVQHETDHLDGVLFVDKISPMAKRMITKRLQQIKKNELRHESERSEENE